MLNIILISDVVYYQLARLHFIVVEKKRHNSEDPSLMKKEFLVEISE